MARLATTNLATSPHQTTHPPDCEQIIAANPLGHAVALSPRSGSGKRGNVRTAKIAQFFQRKRLACQVITNLKSRVSHPKPTNQFTGEYFPAIAAMKSVRSSDIL